MTSNAKSLKLKMHEGYLDHAQAEVWRTYWCVLMGNEFRFYEVISNSQPVHIGSLTIDQDSRVQDRGLGNERDGYKFDLFSKGKINKFKAFKFSDKEIWKAYVEGIATGTMPHITDLLPGQRQDVLDTLSDYFMTKQVYRRQSEPAIPVNKDRWIGFDIPLESHAENDRRSFQTFSGRIRAPPLPLTRQPGDERCLIPRPVVSLPKPKLKFHKDPNNTSVPSWFFYGCSREMAENILKVGTVYGNTLMRENPDSDTGLAISKRNMNSNVPYHHYQICSTQDGYTLRVENVHQPMKSLSEIMEFFAQTSGLATTKPMACNDLKTLGLEPKDSNKYNTKIVKFKHDADSGEETLDSPPRTRKIGFSHTTRDSVNRNIPSLQTLNFQQDGPSHRLGKWTSMPNFDLSELKEAQRAVGLSEGRKPVQTPASKVAPVSEQISPISRPAPSINAPGPSAPIPPKTPPPAPPAAPALYPAPLSPTGEMKPPLPVSISTDNFPPPPSHPAPPPPSIPSPPLPPPPPLSPPPPPPPPPCLSLPFSHAQSPIGNGAPKYAIPSKAPTSGKLSSPATPKTGVSKVPPVPVLTSPSSGDPPPNISNNKSTCNVNTGETNMAANIKSPVSKVPPIPNLKFPSPENKIGGTTGAATTIIHQKQMEDKKPTQKASPFKAALKSPPPRDKHTDSSAPSELEAAFAKLKGLKEGKQEKEAPLVASKPKQSTTTTATTATTTATIAATKTATIATTPSVAPSSEPKEVKRISASFVRRLENIMGGNAATPEPVKSPQTPSKTLVGAKWPPPQSAGFPSTRVECQDPTKPNTRPEDEDEEESPYQNAEYLKA